MKLAWRSRVGCVVVCLLCLALALLWRLFDLTVLHRSFLMQQGQQRFLRVIKTQGQRGMILDRLGEPLAISTATRAVWVNPAMLRLAEDHLKRLAHWLAMPEQLLLKRAQAHANKSFVYLKRGLSPVVGDEIRSLHVPGVFLERESRRYYPQSAVTAHVVGMTDIDGHGQEGLELAMESWLRGKPGKKKVLKDRLGHVVADLGTLKAPESGEAVRLSLDLRLQYLSHQVLANTVERFHARSGSVVVLDVRTGEVLAMVNQPTYDPNDRSSLKGDHFRNRAMTDVFEPGSSFKAMGLAAALSTGRFSPDTRIDTSPGYLHLDGQTVRDMHPLGVISVTQALRRSSNVAMAKMVLTVPRSQMINLLQDFGFGRRSQTLFPGEVAGHLPDLMQMRDIDMASLSFGYGVSVTTLQLAQAYALVANGGLKMPVTFLRRDHPVAGDQVLAPKVAHQLLGMLEQVTQAGGTGYAAQIPHYRVAGKTGTSRVAVHGGYDAHRHVASFVGVAPVSDPRLVVAVVVCEPSGSRYYGSQVAAPAFASIMGGALRLLGSTPDDLTGLDTQVIRG